MPKQAVESRKRASGDWREALRDYARRRCREQPGGGNASAEFPEAARAALGDQADLVRTIVEQLAAGAAGRGGNSREIEVALDEQLSLVLEGIAPRLRRSVPANNAVAQGRPPVFQSELWQLLHRVRESAELS